MSKEYRNRAGLLRHRIAIQRATETRDAIGGFIKSWANQVTRWASVEPISSNELVSAGQQVGQATHRIKIRSYDGLLQTDRFLFGTRPFNILSILDADERDKVTTVLATEVAVGG